MQQEQLYFKDDGKIPNSRYPVLIYRDVFSERGHRSALWLENKFASNEWTNSWRGGIYSYLHYHSTSHEVLGIFSGTALLKLGGDMGENISVDAGDIIIIPAGVGHKNIKSIGLGVVGAYPQGRTWNILKGHEGERPGADQTIVTLPIPATDPLLGKNAGISSSWRSIDLVEVL